MTPEQITALAATGNSETLESGAPQERAARLSKPSAMLNQVNGQVRFGAMATGYMAGQPVSERIYLAGDVEVVAVHVSQGAQRPYPWWDTACQRLGNTALAMSAVEYNWMLLERMQSEQRLENQPTTEGPV